jgi:DNA-binding NarL/FixJ family response regulator
MVPLRVMLVDDHPVVRAGYRRLLELEPDLRVVAEHGDVDSALQSIGQDPALDPHVIVVDLAMPRRNGLELVRELHRQRPSIRVLVFSMHDQPAIVAEALRGGAAGFVTKSCVPEELVRCVRRVMSERPPVMSSDLAGRKVLQQHRDEEPLSAREREVLRRLAAGDSLQAIGMALQISPKTVSNCQTALRQKLGALTPVELLRSARERGLLA